MMSEWCLVMFFSCGEHLYIQAASPNGPQLGPSYAQLGPNWGPYGILLGYSDWSM